MVKPFIIGTFNTEHHLIEGVKILRDGGSALDAVEAATRSVELDPSDTSVGMGGIPNLFGVQEMDASIMCGKTLKAGTVGAIKGFLHPISVARKVFDEAPHVLLVGDGAEFFGKAMGCEQGDLNTDRSREVYQAFLDDALESLPDDEAFKPYIIEYVKYQNLHEWYDKLADEHHGTVNIMAMDSEGNIASAVSTSGTALKFPGRLGDSPIIGAGNYCDNRYGAVACTGRGELAIRASTARSLVMYMAQGMTLEEAATEAMKDIHNLKSPGGMNSLAIDAKGNALSVTTRGDRESYYYYMDVDMESSEKRIGINVPA